MYAFCLNRVTYSLVAVRRGGGIAGGSSGAEATRNRKPIGRNWTQFKRRRAIELQRRRFATGRGKLWGARSKTIRRRRLIYRCDDVCGLWALNRDAAWLLMLFASLVIASLIKLVKDATRRYAMNDRNSFPRRVSVVHPPVYAPSHSSTQTSKLAPQSQSILLRGCNHRTRSV